MSDQDLCLAPEDLDRWKELPDSDSRLVHVQSCPRCRALIEAHRLFHSPTPDDTDPAQLLAANAALTAHIAELTSPTGATSASASEPWWRVLFAPALRPALAFAAITIVVAGAMLGPQFSSRPGPPAMRGGSSQGFALEPIRERPDGGIALHWSLVPEATHYRVQFYSTALESLGESAEFTGAQVVLAPSQLPTGVDRRDLLVRVIALHDGEQITRSAVVPLLP